MMISSMISKVLGSQDGLNPVLPAEQLCATSNRGRPQLL